MGRCLSGSTRHGLPPKPKILAMPLQLAVDRSDIWWTVEPKKVAPTH